MYIERPFSLLNPHFLAEDISLTTGASDGSTLLLLMLETKFRLKQTLIGRAAAGVGWPPPDISAPTRPPEYLSDHRTLAQVPSYPAAIFHKGKTREFSIARKKTPRCRSEDCFVNLQKLSSLRGKHAPSRSGGFTTRFRADIEQSSSQQL